MKQILIVEDDLNISSMLNDYLSGEGYSVDSFSAGEDAFHSARTKKYDLALIDLMLPKMSGFDLIKKIREFHTMPIIILTAKDSDTDKAMGLNLGADDYVTKPFSLFELSARIRANIRRAAIYQTGSAQTSIRIKDLLIYPAEFRVERAGKPVDLTQKEFAILTLLASSPGRAFSKEQIYKNIWNEPYYGNEGVLNSHINRLRKKLEDTGTAENRYIITLWGIGYKMED